MRIEGILRQLVVWQWVLAGLSIAVFRFEVDALPALLQEYAALEAARQPGAGDAVVGWLSLLWALGSFVASAGVFLLRPFARPLYLGMAAAGCVLQALLEPSVTTAWSVAAETGAQVLVGVTLGVLYFSAAREHFTRPIPA